MIYQKILRNVKTVKRKYLFVFLCLAAALALFAGCELGWEHSSGSLGITETEPQNKEPIPMGESGSFSIYIYLCGSNLETKMGAASKNLTEILNSDIPENVNVIVQTGGAKKWRDHGIPADSLNRYIVKNGELILLESLPQGNMGDEATFQSFLSYGVKNYPAEKMCVIAWDHGGGSLEGVCNDENHKFDPLTFTELKGALDKVGGEMTDRFELFGFDACLMANYETAAMIAPYARYFVASEEIEPSGGWDYEAMISAIKAEPEISGGELGRAICEGYYAKAEASGKASSVTLSVTDLTRFDVLENAFEKMAVAMQAKSLRPEGVQNIVLAADAAQKFGGNSAEEGYSNLIDLGSFAEQSIGLQGADDILSALENVIIYRVAGASKEQSTGLSFYYPLWLSGSKLDLYRNEICPSEAMKTYFAMVYDNIPDNTVSFDDGGHVADDGSYEITVSQSSASYIKTVEFLLIEVSETEKDGRTVYEGTFLGRDSDIFPDWSELKFHSNFRGVWPAINGVKLYSTPIEQTNDHIIFTAPVILNQEHTNLRFSFVWDDSHASGGYYELIGTWNGIDPIIGMADKDIRKLTPEDVLEVYVPCTEYQNADFSDRSGISYMSEAVPQGEYVITEEILSEKTYLYQFVVTDIFGREIYSNVAVMTMMYTPEELEDLILTDGEYAAEVSEIIATDRSFGK